MPLSVLGGFLFVKDFQLQALAALRVRGPSTPMSLKAFLELQKHWSRGMWQISNIMTFSISFWPIP